jgi:hypothetical protein
MTVPGEYRPVPTAPPPSEPWTLNYRIMAMAANNALLKYLDTGRLPEYAHVKSGLASLDSARGQRCFLAGRDLAWSADPLAIRDSQQTIWLEEEVSARRQDSAHWRPLTRDTWPDFWRALDDRYHLSEKLQRTI